MKNLSCKKGMRRRRQISESEETQDTSEETQDISEETQDTSEESQDMSEQKSKKKMMPTKQKKDTKSTQDKKDDMNVNEQKLYDFFYNINRPVSNTELVLNFKKQISGPQILNICAELVNKGTLLMKVYSKTKVYMINPTVFDTSEQGQYEDRLKELQDRTQSIKAVYHTKHTELRNIKMVDTEEELDNKLADIETQLDKSRQYIKMKDEGTLVSKEEIEGYEKKMKQLQKIQKERRKLVNNCIDLLADNINMKKAEVIEELELDL